MKKIIMGGRDKFGPFQLFKYNFCVIRLLKKSQRFVGYHSLHKINADRIGAKNVIFFFKTDLNTPEVFIVALKIVCQRYCFIGQDKCH